MNSQGTILLVEDNEDDVFLMKRALKSAKITNPMQVVEDGRQAVEYLAGEGIFADRLKFPYPEIVFLDLKLPHKSGFEVLAWLRENPYLAETNICVLSSSNLPTDIQKAQALGAKAYLVKPPSADALHQIAQKFQVQWQLV